MSSHTSAHATKSQNDNTGKMPVLFVGHGSPVNAIEQNVFTEGWVRVAEQIPIPKAILCISAHWVTHGETRVASTAHPKTQYDFFGFPEELYRVTYDAPGSAELAQSVVECLAPFRVRTDDTQGFDHGTWSVLRNMYPEATIPVVQLSLDAKRSPKEHMELARCLKPLREQGVLIVGSGNMVHHLGMMQAEPHPFAIAVDETLAASLQHRRDDEVVDFLEKGQYANLAHPTPEHFLPLLYFLAVLDAHESVSFFSEGITLGSISMRSCLSTNP